MEVRTSWREASGDLKECVSLVEQEARGHSTVQPALLVLDGAAEDAGPCEVAVSFPETPMVTSRVDILSSARTCELYIQSWGTSEAEYTSTTRGAPSSTDSAHLLHHCTITWEGAKPIIGLRLRLLSLQQKGHAQVASIRIQAGKGPPPQQAPPPPRQGQVAAGIASQLPALLGGIASLQGLSSSASSLARQVSGTAKGLAAEKGGASGAMDPAAAKGGAPGAVDTAPTAGAAEFAVLCARVEQVEALCMRLERSLVTALGQFEVRLQKLEAAHNRGGLRAVESSASISPFYQQAAKQEAAAETPGESAVADPNPLSKATSLSPGSQQAVLEASDEASPDQPAAEASLKCEAPVEEALSPGGPQSESPLNARTRTAPADGHAKKGIAEKGLQAEEDSISPPTPMHRHSVSTDTEASGMSNPIVDCAAALRAMVNESIGVEAPDADSAQSPDKPVGTLPRSPSLELLLAGPAHSVDLFDSQAVMTRPAPVRNTAWTPSKTQEEEPPALVTSLPFSSLSVS